jgi:hypothetical protein
MKLQAPIAALLLAVMPATALADNHDGYRGGQSYSRPATSVRSYQQAPRYQAAPQRSFAAPQRSYAAPQQRYVAPERSYGNVQPRERYVGPAYNGGYGRGYAARGYIGSPRYNYVGHPWGWNAGRVWVAQPGYWGGGFWGAFALGVTIGGADYAGGYYAAQSGYPGYQLLANYGLQQTDCDQPNLVDIYGPDGSEICAYPNDMVAPGAYNVDPATLTLVSQ